MYDRQLGFDPDQLNWRAPSGSSGNSGCLHVAKTPDGRIAMRDTVDPHTVIVCRPEDLRFFVAAARKGEYDDLTA